MLAAERGRPGTPRRPLVALDAHTVGRRQTGNERYVLEVARALLQRDEVDVLAYVDRGVTWPADYSPAPQLAELHARAPQLRIPLELPIRTRRDHADLLQVTYVRPPVAGLPVVTVVHDLSFEDQPAAFSLPTRLRLQLFVRLAARSSAALIAISEFTRQRLIDVYGLPPERVHFLAPGVGSQWRPPTAEEIAEVRERFELPAAFVLAVGAAHPRKNLPRVIAAVERLRSTSHPDLKLVLCGPAPVNGPGADAVRDTEARGTLLQLGYVTDQELRALYGAADAFIYASLYEGFGLPVLEALACGATVVASQTTAVGEAAGDAAVKVDPSDVESITNGLGAALNDSAMRHEIGGRVPDHLARFSWDSHAAGLTGVYREVIGRGRSSP